MPNEVIVVDNNSVDNTAEIARSYDFVTLVNEEKQGMIHARNKGFSVAKGDILGRIDCDARITEKWVETALNAFGNPKIAAISGPGITLTSHVQDGKRTIFWSQVYFIMARAILRVEVLWGANMLLRKSAWETIKDKTCINEKVVHEDEDISMLLAGAGLRSAFVDALRIETDGDTYFDWPKLREYISRGFHTRTYHLEMGTLDNNKAVLVPIYYSVIAIAIGTAPTILFVTLSFLYILLKRFIHLVRPMHRVPRG